MSIPTDEQETIVQYDRNGDTATIFTSDVTQMTRLDKIYPRHREHRNADGLTAVEYVIDKGLVSFRAKRIKRNLTDEQKAAASARLKARWKKTREGQA